MMRVSKSDNGWKVPRNFHVFKSLTRKKTFEHRPETGEELYSSAPWGREFGQKEENNANS